MPSFNFLDNLELFLRTGTYPVNASKSSKKVTRAASKHFIYKDGSLWRRYRGRLLRVVRSDEEMREVLTRYHDNNNHAGRVRAVKEIMLMYYWVGVTEAVKNWIKACAVCQNRTPQEPHNPPVQFCLVYGCDASSYVYPQLSFHRFPKEAERRRKWLAVAQRDEGSLRSDSFVCSRHFDSSCFKLSEEGQLTLSSHAVPTTFPEAAQRDEAPLPADQAFRRSNTLEDVHSTAAAAETTECSDPAIDHPETPVQLQEHQYCLPAPELDSRAAQAVRENRRKPSFTVYNHIARYLSHRILPMQSKKSRSAIKRMAKRFGLVDGVLMYTRVSPPLRVPRSREEVNSILQQFHDNQGHYGQGICQREITKHFYWASMTRDLAGWISSCHTCLNRTKRKWLRCSIFKCTNCCGPVERGLGLTFHKFPLQNAALLAQWLNAVGRSNWHPRLWSSICSTHFTEDCFDRSGEKVTLHPDAVPTLMVHSDSATQSRDPTKPAAGVEAIFAKYDAVERYISRRTYPPGLSYVEKNTFRRFCKKYVIKDGKLHTVRGDRMCLVLRNRQQVEAALVDFHSELNHLDVDKCLRLLNERYYWKTMRPDVVQWINSCSQCSMRRMKKPDNRAEAGGSEMLLQALSSPRHDSDSGKDDDTDEGGGSEGDTEEPPTISSVDAVIKPSSPRTETPIKPQPRIPILLHLRTPVNIQPRTPIILQPGAPRAHTITRVWSVKTAASPQSETQRGRHGSDSQRGIQIREKAQPVKSTQPQEQGETSSSEGGVRTRNSISTRPPPDCVQPPGQNSGPKTQISTPVQLSVKRSSNPEADSPAHRTSSCGLEPVVAPSTKPWPVFTIAGATPAPEAKPPRGVDSSPAISQRSRMLRARAVIQQCSQAKVKIRPALDGADAQWAEIQEGMVVYVCFLHGATEDVTYEMANSLMTTKLFRKDSGHSVSLLDLPGSILFVPQDSLLGKPASSRRMQFRGGCELWWGAQLFSNLVSACRELVSGSAKSTKTSVKVEHGVYGQKQELVLHSPEPLTLLLEF